MITKKTFKTMGEIVSILDECKTLSYKLESLDAEKSEKRWKSNMAKEWFESNSDKVENFDTLFTLAKNYRDMLENLLTEEEKEYFVGMAMEEWIHPDYSRMYYNELDNRVEIFCETFDNILSTMTKDCKYSVLIYDLSDIYFEFETEKQARNFIDELESPWSLMEDHDTYRDEIACG